MRDRHWKGWPHGEEENEDQARPQSAGQAEPQEGPRVSHHETAEHQVKDSLARVALTSVLGFWVGFFAGLALAIWVL